MSSVRVIMRFPLSSIIADLIPMPVSPLSPFTFSTITERRVSPSTVKETSVLLVSGLNSPPMYQPLRIYDGSSTILATRIVPSRILLPLVIFSFLLRTVSTQPSIIVGKVTVYSGISSTATRICVSILILPVL